MLNLYQDLSNLDPNGWPTWAIGIVAILSAFSLGGGYKAVELWLKAKVEIKKIEAEAKADNYNELIAKVQELEDKVDKAREVEMALVAETAALKVEVKLLMERNKILLSFVQKHFEDFDLSTIENNA